LLSYLEKNDLVLPGQATGGHTVKGVRKGYEPDRAGHKAGCGRAGTEQVCHSAHSVQA